MSRKILILPLLLWAVVAMSEPIPSPVPAMIVYGTDGSRQVVRLETTDVTDLIVMQTGQSLSVDIPESHSTGVRSITFAMFDEQGIAAIESTEIPLIQGVEKIVRNGQVLIRLHMQNGAIIEYDIRGNKITD